MEFFKKNTVGGLRTTASTILVVIVIAVILIVAYRHFAFNVRCTRATITWHEPLERDDIRRERNESSTIIESDYRAQQLYCIFALSQSDQIPAAGWVSSAVIEFDFSNGSKKHVFIDNSFRTWSGLSRKGDMVVPEELLDLFGAELGLSRDVP